MDALPRKRWIEWLLRTVWLVAVVAVNLTPTYRDILWLDLLPEPDGPPWQGIDVCAVDYGYPWTCATLYYADRQRSRLPDVYPRHDISFWPLVGNFAVGMVAVVVLTFNCTYALNRILLHSNRTKLPIGGVPGLVECRYFIETMLTHNLAALAIAGYSGRGMLLFQTQCVDTQESSGLRFRRKMPLPSSLKGLPSALGFPTHV